MSRIAVPLVLAVALSSCTRPPAPPASSEGAVDSPPASARSADPCASAGPDRPADCPPVQPASAGVSPEELAAVDSDGDHIDDLIDRCPNDPEDPDGVADDDGCPDQEAPPAVPHVPTSIQEEQHPPRQFP